MNKLIKEIEEYFFSNEKNTTKDIAERFGLGISEANRLINVAIDRRIQRKINNKVSGQ